LMAALTVGRTVEGSLLSCSGSENSGDGDIGRILVQ
jgi:hypothetical protein